MNTKETYKVIILDGPCSADLWHAGAHAYDKLESDKHTHFVIKSPHDLGGRGADLNLWVRIIGVQHEDGSNKSFNVEGYVSDGCPIKILRNRHFTGYYNAGSPRRGWLVIELE